MLRDILPLPVHHLVVLQVLYRDGEVVGGLVVDHVPHHRAELDVPLYVLLGPSTLEVVQEHLSYNRVQYWIAFCFTIFPLSLGWRNIDDQYREPNTNERYNLVRQPVRCWLWWVSLPWWKWWNRLAKVLLKGVIGELQTFLGSIGPQVPD